jgi:UDP-2,3-diacylglucosamine hydrolase
MRHIFISDLHLSENTPQINSIYEAFSLSLSANDTLYILGDFFNYWLGKDCMSPFQETILSGLKRLNEKGICVKFMVGNRDFLMEPDLLESYNIAYLQDPTCLVIDGLRVLLSHGDQWCTDNVSYQRFRRVVRNKGIIAIFRALPQKTRLKIAEKLRQHSTKKNYEPLEDINIEATDFETHQADLIIHGHTHNPITQVVSNQAGQSVKRIALSDWGPKGNALILENGQENFIYF